MNRVVGIDLGDRKSHYCVLNEDGVVIEEGSVQSTPAAFKAHFEALESSLIALEVGVRRAGLPNDRRAPDEPPWEPFHRQYFRRFACRGEIATQHPGVATRVRGERAFSFASAVFLASALVSA